MGRGVNGAGGRVVRGGLQVESLSMVGKTEVELPKVRFEIRPRFD